jgi:hypothetical protein
MAQYNFDLSGLFPADPNNDFFKLHFSYFGEQQAKKMSSLRKL